MLQAPNHQESVHAQRTRRSVGFAFFAALRETACSQHTRQTRNSQHLNTVSVASSGQETPSSNGARANLGPREPRTARGSSEGADGDGHKFRPTETSRSMYGIKGRHARTPFTLGAADSFLLSSLLSAAACTKIQQLSWSFREP